ncbi:hypothetical protein ABZS66_00100 [Dactylosporangium sp. NPDC005572]|uniref:hypothetical protein n=1 Tax=Dactylosporangium sp. NPDC005572 TaxID=3156889 RepID=UPI0033B6A9D1
MSFELAAHPKEGARATLADVPAGRTPTTEMVGCRQFTVAAVGAAGRGPQGFQESKIWAAKESRCDAVAEALLPALGASTAPPPPPVKQECELLDQQCKLDKAVDEAVQRGVDAGIQGVISLLVQGAAVVLSMLAKQVFTQTSIGAPDESFYLVYNSTAGIMLIFVFVLFIISAIINTLRFNGGPGPLASVGGLVRAVLGITFAGGIAWLIVTAWDQATNALIAQNADTNWDASVWITALTNLSGGAGTGALALVGGLLALVGLFFLLIIMLFRGMLTTAAALFGAVAMAGQASHETRSWGRRWFWTVNALAMSKFAIAALWIYGTRAAYESDDVTTVLQAVLIIWLMVFAPGILLRLTAIWDGYLADVNGRGFATAAAAGIGDLLGRAVDSAMDGRSGGNGAGDAAMVMDDNLADIDDAGQLAGTGGGAGETASELAGEVDRNTSGEPVGATSGEGGPAAGDDRGGSPNAEEAEAIDVNAAGARHDAAATRDMSRGTGRATSDRHDDGGHMSVPADPTGASGAGQDLDLGTSGGSAADPAAGAGTSQGLADALSGGSAGGADGAGSAPGGGASAGSSGGPAAGGGGSTAAAAAAI